MNAIAPRPTDLELLHRVRRGQHAAFGELWIRYEGWAHHLARTLTSRYEPEDIVQQAFTKILISLRNGNGPTEGFAHYLRIAIRSVAAAWGARDSRATLVPLPDDTALGSYTFEVSDLGVLERPFRSLPERWQRILTLTWLQGLPVAEAAAELGLSIPATAALAARAWKGLRAALAAASGEGAPGAVAPGRSLAPGELALAA